MTAQPLDVKCEIIDGGPSIAPGDPYKAALVQARRHCCQRIDLADVKTV